MLQYRLLSEKASQAERQLSDALKAEKAGLEQRVRSQAEAIVRLEDTIRQQAERLASVDPVRL